MQRRSTIFSMVEPSDVNAQDLGAAVVLTGIARIKVKADGNPLAFGVRFTDVCIARRAVADGDLAADEAVLTYMRGS